MKILVPLNGTAHCETVLPYLQEFARRLKAKVILLRIIDPMAFAEETLKGAQQYLSKLSEGFTGIPIRTLAKRGPSVEMICQIAGQEGADLIAFAPHGHSGVTRWIFGSVAEEVARHAPCPVFLIRGEAHLGFHHVVVPSDGSAESLALFQQLRHFAPAPVLRGTLLHCHPEGALDGALQARLREHVSHYPGWTLQVVEGEPGTAVVDWLLDSDCDLIAMATHGEGGLRHVWSSSLTEHLAHRVACPMLVFPPASLPQMKV